MADNSVPNSPVRQADVDPVFYKQLMAQRQQAEDEYKQRADGKPVKWNMPEKYKWKGSPFDWEGMRLPFSRAEANKAFVNAINKPGKPGTSGDLIITSLQVDWLSTMERAFRARHTSSWPRMAAQALGRRRGQGNQESGLFTRGILEYIRGLIRTASPKK